MKNFILDGKKVVAESDSKKWGRWMEDKPRHVADTRINIVMHTKGPLTDKNQPDEVRVSTVFLGLDHNMSASPAAILNECYNPVVFETMIFGGEHDDYQTRCRTWEQAEDMHMTACKLVIMGEDE